MTSREAKAKLALHSGRCGEFDDAKLSNGFLGMLRPYRGELRQEDFHDVIACLKALSDELRSKEVIDRNVVSDIMGILHLTRSWALHPNGMLRRNELIKGEDQARLAEWLGIIEYAFMMILDATDLQDAFLEYEDYCEREGGEE